MTHFQNLLVMTGALFIACAPAPPLPEPVPIPVDTAPATAQGVQLIDDKSPPENTDTSLTHSSEAENTASETADRYLDYRYFPTAKAALLDIIATTTPKVIGFGEYHSQTGHEVVSALNHFSSELLPAISKVTSDIVVEAMVTEGNCVALQEEVTAEVKEDTQRPEETEDEVSVLFEKARAHGVFPHFLTMTCDDHQSVYGGEFVDYEKLLQLIGAKLLEKTTDVISSRASRHRRNPKPIVAVYGGAIHNDVNPQREWRAYSFGRKLKKKIPDGKYIEIDLIVPEIAKDIPFVKEAEWFPLFKDKTSPEKTLLIKRSETEYLLVFPGSL